MQEVFLILLEKLQEHVPNEETRRDIYVEIVPALDFVDLELLESIKYEDGVFCEVCSEYRGEDKDENEFDAT